MCSIALLANDVPPGFCVPVAAPGLRVFGLAEGLRAHGISVSIIIPRHVIRRVFPSFRGIPRPKGAVIVRTPNLSQFLSQKGYDFLCITNYIQYPAVLSFSSGRLVYDLFAPKLLEKEATSEPSDAGEERGSEQAWARKSAALSQASLVVVNGWKKLEYAREMVEAAGTSLELSPIPAPMSVPIQSNNLDISPKLEPGGMSKRPKVIMAGYLQGWSLPGEWLVEAAALIGKHRCELQVLMPLHWGGSGWAPQSPALQRVLSMEHVTSFPPETFGRYLSRVASCQVVLDLFADSTERRYAMVTRTVTALAAGAPVIHPPFTEVAPLIEQYDAGWLVDPSALDGVRDAINEALGCPERAEKKAANAARLYEEVFHPEPATREFAKGLREVIKNG